MTNEEKQVLTELEYEQELHEEKIREFFYKVRFKRQREERLKREEDILEGKRG